MDLAKLLPPHPGYLPLWLLFISVVSIGNSVQAYISTSGTRQVYSSPTVVVTALNARTFGTWTAISSFVRLYAAYHITNKQVYELALWTFVVAWLHFIIEWWGFGTARWGKGLAGPIFVATFSLGWMLNVWGDYV
ncbi:ergosterol 28 [Piedraia hortae CBS 480.64]|uniref:Ergosterol 28 n=1 Tax=Piedraia hortae CBS 480.64 TaxID=1314780 RepID=A0A6A7CAG8_9PEZI|nr:ergosterol 28 [Piedraia hortae CBS 480.64]